MWSLILSQDTKYPVRPTKNLRFRIFLLESSESSLIQLNSIACSHLLTHILHTITIAIYYGVTDPNRTVAAEPTKWLLNSWPNPLTTEPAQPWNNKPKPNPAQPSRTPRHLHHPGTPVGTVHYCRNADWVIDWLTEFNCGKKKRHCQSIQLGS